MLTVYKFLAFFSFSFSFLSEIKHFIKELTKKHHCLLGHFNFVIMMFSITVFCLLLMKFQIVIVFAFDSLKTYEILFFRKTTHNAINPFFVKFHMYHNCNYNALWQDQIQDFCSHDKIVKLQCADLNLN